MNNRVVLIIDEYPYLAESDRAVSSLLQALIDKYQENSRLFLILCGSSMSFMENQVLGYKSPLYGRRTSQFKIKPFDYYESAEMLKTFSDTDKITLYGICGGIPEYVARINKDLSVQQNVESLFFNPTGRLFEEPSNLLKQELKAPQTYNAIITAIASGAGKVNDIATKAGIETSQCSNMLATLLGLEIIKKEYPAGDAGTSKKTFYRLADLMFRFWYRFVMPDLSRISMGFGKIVCSEIFAKPESVGKIETYMGPVFEECSAQFLWREMGKGMGTGKGRFSFETLGRWWGPNPKEKREEEIDLVATGGSGAIFAECKWRNARTGTETLEDLIRKSELFPSFGKDSYTGKQYVLFSKSGFTAQLQKAAILRKDVILISPKEMF
jgi:AAA+ ATPase superfamily predicted ATPase